MKVRIVNLTAPLLLGLITAICYAQDFSADIAYRPVKTRDGDSQPAPAMVSSRIYVSNDKVRLESRGWSDTVLLVNFGNHIAKVFFPSQKAYQQLAETPEQYFRVSDAENACPDWQKALGKQVKCAKIGSETVGGRVAIK